MLRSLVPEPICAIDRAGYALARFPSPDLMVLSGHLLRRFQGCVALAGVERRLSSASGQFILKMDRAAPEGVHVQGGAAF
jgi:hypothetical protein